MSRTKLKTKSTCIAILTAIVSVATMETVMKQIHAATAFTFQANRPTAKPNDARI